MQGKSGETRTGNTFLEVRRNPLARLSLSFKHYLGKSCISSHVMSIKIALSMCGEDSRHGPSIDLVCALVVGDESSILAILHASSAVEQSPCVIIEVSELP